MVDGSQVPLIHSHAGTWVPSILSLCMVRVVPSLEEGERVHLGGGKTSIHARTSPEVTSSLLLTFHWPELSHMDTPSYK